MRAKCLVCGCEANQEPQRAGNQKIDCEACGVYLVSANLNALDHSREELGDALVRAKRHTKPGVLAFLSEESF